MFYRAEISDQYQNKDFFIRMKRLRYRRHTVNWDRKLQKQTILFSQEGLGEKFKKLFGDTI